MPASIGKAEHWVTGVTSLTQAVEAVQAGAQVIVLHQHPLSVRFVSMQTSADIARQCKVPVWVQFENDHPAVIQKILTDVRPKGIIFAGREKPEFCESFKLSYAKRVVMHQGFSRDELLQHKRAQYHIIDAYSPPVYGEYGRVPYLWAEVQKLDFEKLILAGQIPFKEAENLKNTMGLVGFEWGPELESRPWTFDQEKLKQFSEIARKI